jgi:hypothetical protein
MVNKPEPTTKAPAIILAPTVAPPPEKQNVEFYIEPAEPDINVDIWSKPAPAPVPPPHHQAPPPPPPHQQAPPPPHQTHPPL